jgi:transglutaminase-like putative cysteine protease
VLITLTVGLYGVPPCQDEPIDSVRLVSGMLAAILDRDDAPLTVERDPARRLVGNCRQPAVLLVAMLRHKGIPARKRVGFARYLPGPGATIHEIAQCWDASQRRWRLVDRVTTRPSRPPSRPTSPRSGSRAGRSATRWT